MNNETLTKQNEGALPFPAHVRSQAPNADCLPLSRDIVEMSRDANNVFKSAGNVHKFVRTHYVDMETGVYGIERLIAKILSERSAVFPKGIENSEYRSVAIASAMFASDIIKVVQTTFGEERYPYATVHTYLSNFMTKQTCQNKVGKIHLSNAEDCDRKCCKPRVKYYLLETPA